MAHPEYQSAALAVRELHILRDYELVSPGAEQHGVNVTVGKFFDPMSRGDYNIRLPEGDTYEYGRVKGVRGVAKLCIDFRQSADVASIAERDGLVAWADAGGPVQPNENILRVDMSFWESLLSVNAEIVAYLFAHLEVCGGANHYTDGRMRKLRETKVLGSSLERSAMQGYLQSYAKELKRLKRDIPITLGIVNISNNKFQNVDYL